MKKLYLLLLVALVFITPLKSIWAQVLLNEDFTLPAGVQINSNNGWTAHSGTGTNPITITSPGLTYTGYIGSAVGNAVSLVTSGEDDNKLLTSPVTSGTIYASAMINCSAAQTGDYFFHLGTGTSSFYSRLYIKSSGSGFVFGLSKTNGTAVYTSASTPYTFGVTYLVVLKYTYIAGTTNDQADLYVFSSPSMPSTEPASVLSTTDAGATTDATTITAVYLRQGSSSAAPTVQIDGIRAGLTWSDILPPTSPAAPVALAATSITANSFTANWNMFAGSIGYWIDVSTAADFSTFISGYNNKDMGNNTSFGISPLDPNTTYYYRVRSFDGTVATPNSNTINVTTLVAAPIANAATNISSTSFTANWGASAGATDYWIDVSTVSDFSTTLAGYTNKETGNVITFNISSLTAGLTYYYRVRASNSNGTSDNSSVITITTSNVPTPVVQNPTNIASDGFTASWSFTDIALNYFIDVSTSSDFSSFVDGYSSKELGLVTTYKISPLNPSTVYYFRVHAATAGGTSPNSNVMSVTTLLAAPVATPATNLTTSGFKANWNVSVGAANYWLDVSTVSDFSTVLSSYDNKPVGNVTSYSVTGLNLNTTYYYRITSSNSLGTSPFSNTITVATLLVGINDQASGIPSSYGLYQNYPNPFNPSTIIKYQIPESGYVTLKVYNMLGDEISTLVNETKSAGVHEAKFDAINLTSGIYVYKIQAGNYLQIKKMILVK